MISLSPFTGYQQKGIYYYKTRHEGTCVNINAEYLNNRFKENLRHFEFDNASASELKENILELLEIGLESVNRLFPCNLYDLSTTESADIRHRLKSGFSFSGN